MKKTTVFFIFLVLVITVSAAYMALSVRRYERTIGIEEVFISTIGSPAHDVTMIKVENSSHIGSYIPMEFVRGDYEALKPYEGKTVYIVFEENWISPAKLISIQEV